MLKSWSIAWEDRLLKDHYPAAAKRLIPLVEDECDRMEYAGSRMYDEIPDKLMMQKTAKRICRKARQSFPETAFAQTDAMIQKKPEELYVDDEIFATDFRASHLQSSGEESMLELAEVLLYHELFLRRCEKRLRAAGCIGVDA